MAESSKSRSSAGAGAGAEGPKMSNFMPDFDFQKAFSAMKIPSMPDMEVVLGAYRRNLEALSEANRVALEGAQTVARRHMEIMQKTMADLSEQLRRVTADGSAQDRASRQAELLKHAYESAVANMRELGDLIQRSNHDAVETLNKRFAEAMDEMKNLIEHKKKP